MSENDGILTGDGLITEVGSEYLQHGLTRVLVAPNGQVRIVKREQGKDQQFESLINESQAQSLAKRVEVAAKATYGQRGGLPDEPRYRLSVIREGNPTAELEVWRSELREAKELAGVVAELQGLVQRASDGAAIL